MLASISSKMTSKVGFCVLNLFLWLGASDHAKLYKAHIEAAQHQKHRIRASLCGEPRSQQTKNGLEIQAASNDSLPKGCNDVAPIISLDILGPVLLQKFDIIICGAPTW